MPDLKKPELEMPELETGVDLAHDVVRELTTRHDWRLLDVATFARHLAARAQTVDATERETLVRLAVNLYCEQWHAACRDTGARRERAYTEVAHYLYDRARHKYGDAELAQEITHDAIILVAEQIDHCQKPGAFLAFALLKLWNAATLYFRRRDRYVQHTETLPGQVDTAEEGAAAIPAFEPSPEAHAVTTDFSRALLTRLGELMAESPRGQQQFKAVLLKYLYAYSDEEIAQELATDVQNVHVLRSRGMKRLREDAVLRRLFEEGA